MLPQVKLLTNNSIYGVFRIIQIRQVEGEVVFRLGNTECVLAMNRVFLQKWQWVEWVLGLAGGPDWEVVERKWECRNGGLRWR